MAGGAFGETTDPNGKRVVLPAPVWQGKVLRDHVEMREHRADVMRTVAAPDHVEPDPLYEARTRYYRRGAGPSAWLMVVVSYEQEPARIITAFGNRKDPRTWSE